MSFSIHEAPACAQLDRAFACFEQYRNARASAHRLRHRLQWAVTTDGHRLHRIDVETGLVIADLGPRCESLERLAIKRIRDRHQADVVQALIDSGRLQSALTPQPT